MSAVRVVDEHLLSPVLVYSGSGGVFENELQLDTQGGILREQIGSLLVVKNDFNVVAALTGSVFTGPAVFSGGLSGSLQTLPDGTPYLRGADCISVITGTDGSIELSVTGDVVTFDTLLSSSDLTIGGDVRFTGDVFIEGALYGGSPLDVMSPVVFHDGLSGSLTQLTDGSSYLVAGDGISIVTGSSGQITITATGAGSGGGSGGTPSTALITELVLNEAPAGAIDGANSSFTLAYTPATASSVMLWLNGQLLTQGAGKDFTVTSQTVTLSFPPQAGDVLLTMYTKTTQTKLFAMNEAATRTDTAGVIGLELVNTPTPSNSLMLFLNGQLLTQGSDYTLSGKNVSVTGSFIQEDDVVLATYSYLS
jgi:hypothetical protein